MKVLQIHNAYLQAGGEDSVVRAEADLLEAAGHHVTRWQATNPTSTIDKVASLALAPWNPASRREARQRGKEARPDVAHVHNTWYRLSPSVLGPLHDLGVPVVMTLHNFRLTCSNALLQRDGAPCDLCVGGSPWHAVRYSCYRDSRMASAVAATTIALNRKLGSWTDNVDRFVTLSNFAREKLIEAGLPADRTIVKPNFVTDPGPRFVPPESSDFVLYAGRLVDGKGILALLEAWSLVATPVKLVIAGDGPLYDRLSLDLPPGVAMIGWIDQTELTRLMLEARALLFPSEYYENMPMTVIEAFAAGLPVLASDIGSTAEIVSPLGSRWLAPPANPLRWAEALSVLSDPDEVATAGRTARGMFEREYTQDTALERLLDAYAF